MKFNDIAVGLFNDSESYFNLLVYENQECSIYGNNQGLVVGHLNDINYKIVTVEEIITMNSKYYYKINYRNKIKGYFEPKNSIVLIPKARQQVKINSTLEFNSEINEHLLLDDELFESVKNKIGYSTSYAVYQEEVFELIQYREEVVGFFKTSSLNHLIKYSVEFSIIEGSTTYKDSSHTKPLSFIEPKVGKYRSDVIIPAENTIRFEYNGTLNWIPISSTDINYNHSKIKFDNPSEILLKSIVYQYKDKLRKSHAYSLKLLKS